MQRHFFLSEADRIDAKEKLELLKLHSAIAARDDKGEALKKYSQYLTNRMYKNNNRQRAIMLNAIEQASAAQQYKFNKIEV